MSFRDSLINGLDKTIRVSTPILKTAFNLIEKGGYHAAKFSRENASSEERLERANRFIERYEEKHGKK